MSSPGEHARRAAYTLRDRTIRDGMLSDRECAELIQRHAIDPAVAEYREVMGWMADMLGLLGEATYAELHNYRQRPCPYTDIVAVARALLEKDA